MKLSEFTGEKAFDIAAKAMPIILKIRYNENTVKYLKDVYNPKNKETNGGQGVHVYDIYCEMIKNEPKLAMELFALLNDKKPEDFKPNAATLINDMINAFLFDDDLMVLFGLRVQTNTEASSGLATENTEA